MKKSAFALLLVTAVIVSPMASARDWFTRNEAYQLEPVQWVGSFRCEEKLHDAGHRSDHVCDLRFVNEQTGETWTVRGAPTLAALHEKYNGPVRAQISALSSPRFLLGESFVEVTRIEVL